MRPPIASVILTGTENPIALPVIRALNDFLPDTPIHLFSRDLGPVQSAKFSRYIHSHTYFTSTTNEKLIHDEELVNVVRKKVRSDGPSILLPVNEYFVRKLSLLKNELEKHVFLPPLPDPELFDALVHKDRLHKLLVQKGLPAAETHCLSGIEDIRTNVNFFPCLLKPVRGSAGYGIVKLDHPNELKQHLLKINPDDYILQELVPGADIDCSLLAMNGEIQAITIQKGLSRVGYHFPTAIGFEHNPVVLKYAEKLIRDTGFNGLAHLDFRLDKRDGLPKLIDFNSRFWHSIMGSKAAGVDFIMLICLAAMNIPFTKPKVTNCNYFMGKNALSFTSRFRGFRSSSNGVRSTSDILTRMRDPLPEIVRLL